MGKFLAILSFLFLWQLATTPMWAIESPFLAGNAAASASPKNRHRQVAADWRVFKLYKFLAERDSPLSQYAADFIAQADYYQIDWRILAAISGLESQFGRFIIPGSFNAYGYAGGRFYFQDWPKSIAHMSRYLSAHYYRRGLDNPEKIAPVYAPPCQYWAATVQRLMVEIAKSP